MFLLQLEMALEMGRRSWKVEFVIIAKWSISLIELPDESAGNISNDEY